MTEFQKSFVYSCFERKVELLWCFLLRLNHLVLDGGFRRYYSIFYVFHVLHLGVYKKLIIKQL